jgi:hypothetical protein
VLFVSACLALPVDGAAQARRDGRLLITVIDQSNAVIPSVSVTVTGAEDLTRAVAPLVVQTDNAGVATIGSLVPGRYNVAAEFPGFEPGGIRSSAFARVTTGTSSCWSSSAIRRRSRSGRTRRAVRPTAAVVRSAPR